MSRFDDNVTRYPSRGTWLYSPKLLLLTCPLQKVIDSDSYITSKHFIFEQHQQRVRNTGHQSKRPRIKMPKASMLLVVTKSSAADKTSDKGGNGQKNKVYALPTAQSKSHMHVYL